MSNGNFLFTSESVTEGHPDKIADNISDAILDAILKQDPTARVACETLVTTGLAVVAGEITTTATVNYKDIIRDTIHERSRLPFFPPLLSTPISLAGDPRAGIYQINPFGH